MGRTVVRMEKSSGKTPPGGDRKRRKQGETGTEPFGLSERIGQISPNRPRVQVKRYIYPLTREQLRGGGTDLDLVGDSVS